MTNKQLITYNRNHTLAAVLRRKRYRQSPKGKFQEKKCNASKWMHKAKKKYKLSYKGKLSESRFNSSDKSRAIKKRYTQSICGRFYTYKVSAKHRNKSFDLLFDQFKSFWRKPCHYCGSSIATIGLDRVNNSIGYSMGNIVSCCTNCNIAKRTMSPIEYIKHCKLVATHNS